MSFKSAEGNAKFTARFFIKVLAQPLCYHALSGRNIRAFFCHRQFQHLLKPLRILLSKGRFTQAPLAFNHNDAMERSQFVQSFQRWQATDEMRIK